MAHKKKGFKKGTSAGNGASKPQAPAAHANGEPQSYKEAVTSSLDVNGSGTSRYNSQGWTQSFESVRRWAVSNVMEVILMCNSWVSHLQNIQALWVSWLRVTRLYKRVWF